MAVRPHHALVQEGKEAEKKAHCRKSDTGNDSRKARMTRMGQLGTH